MPVDIIKNIPTELIEKELTQDAFLRKTNKGQNEIYIVDAFTAPNIMKEIGRLREISFRMAGGGSGKECDIDQYDLMTPPCRQLIVWDPVEKVITGGYRFILGEDVKVDENNVPRIATSHLFKFSERFIKSYLPFTIELGRSFVRLEYQSSKVGAKAIFALDNLWDGLGALTVIFPKVKYLFGKFTMYPGYNKECRNMLLYFLKKHFPDDEQLMVPINPLEYDFPEEKYHEMFPEHDFKEDYKILNTAIREHGINIPPLVNAYMMLSPTMKTFGTAINDEFGDVEETGILLTIEDIFEEKKSRHIASYAP